MDNHSRYSKSELMRIAMETDAQIYTIAPSPLPRNAKAIQVLEERQGLTLLSDLARNTGGLPYVIAEPADTGKIIANIGAALRNQYVIGYRPTNSSRDGKWHTIQVKTTLRNVNASARGGYYR